MLDLTTRLGTLKLLARIKLFVVTVCVLMLVFDPVMASKDCDLGVVPMHIFRPLVWIIKSSCNESV
jgi:hypothetical protein